MEFPQVQTSVGINARMRSQCVPGSQKEPGYEYEASCSLVELIELHLAWNL